MPGHSPFKPIALIFATTLLAYLLVWSGRHYSIDGIVMFEYAKALLFQRSFQMDPPIYWAGLNIEVSVWSLGQTLVYAPLLLALAALFPGNALYRQIPHDPHNPYNPLLLENTPYRFGSLVHPLTTALTAGLVYVLGRRLGLSEKWACAAALIFGLASPAAAYAKYDFAQPLVALFLLAGVIAVTHLDGGALRAYFLAGLFLGLSILTRTEMAAIAAPPFGLAALWQARNGVRQAGGWRRALLQLAAFAAPLAGILLFLLWANQQRFGAPLRFGFTSGDFSFNQAEILAGLAGTLASPGRGLVFFFPLSLLAPLGLARLPAERRQARFVIAWLVAASILVYAAWGYWSGGRSWGPRFLTPLLPYLAVLAALSVQAPSAARRRAGTWLFWALAALGWAATLQGVLFESMNDLAAENAFSLTGETVFSGWERLATLEQIDIFWVQKLAAGNVAALLAALILLALLLGCGWAWVRLLRRAT